MEWPIFEQGIFWITNEEQILLVQCIKLQQLFNGLFDYNEFFVLFLFLGAEVFGVRRTVDGYTCTPVKFSALVHTCSTDQIADMCQNDSQPHRRLNRQNTSLCSEEPWNISDRAIAL